MVCCGVGLAAALSALCSLSWRMVLDTPNMLYQANLMVNHGMMPYRDFFCINLPGSLWMYGWLIRCLGVSDWTVHLANLLLVSLVSALVYYALSRSCQVCALLGVGLGVLRIFSGEVAFILERELLALIPISGLMALGFRKPMQRSVREIVAGLLLAWVFLIKPQLVLYGAPSVYLLVRECTTFRDVARTLGTLGGACLLPVAACGLWLVKNGAWAPFCDTVHYWTLYGQMTQSFSYVPPAERMHAVWGHVYRMIASPFMLLACGSLAVACKNKVLARHELVFWALLLPITVVAPALTGQFWGYHRLPFFYFTLCAGGYLLSGRAWTTGLAVLVSLIWIPFTALHVYRETTVPSLIRLTDGIADEFETYLREKRQPGDRVQPIDWTDGAVQAMLMTDALPATRFFEYYYFLHSVSNPLILRLRQEFLDTLAQRPPRFLLEATTVTWPHGLDTVRRFEAFEAWKNAHYRVSKEGDHYRIWEFQQ
jgi:hypothetical protein